MMQGEAFRYVGRMVADRTGPRLLVSWMIVLALCLPLHFATRDSAPTPEMLNSMVSGMHFQLACLAAVVLFHGIVAEDRVKGYYRFYLAKPVSPLWFYGQSYLLALAAIVLFSIGFLAIFSLSVVPAWQWQMLTSGLALGLVVGGMVFALSTVTQRDWIWLIILVIFFNVLRNRFPSGRSTLGTVLSAVMPPTHLVNERTLSAAQWAWVAGWGIGLLVLGLWVLRRRPLGED